MEIDYTIVKLITEASLLVQIVMLILVTFSIVSWTLIFIKEGEFRKEQKRIQQFENRFFGGDGPLQLAEELSQQKEQKGLERIFYAGHNEYYRSTEGSTQSVDSAQRAMFVAESRELSKLEKGLSFFSTIGSVSPYIGLFGTVWGIMNSFIALGHMGQASLETVAPGIAEALIATAFGLFAAIPAYIAYNRFSSQIDSIGITYENFRTEFLIYLDRKRYDFIAKTSPRIVTSQDENAS